MHLSIDHAVNETDYTIIIDVTHKGETVLGISFKVTMTKPIEDLKTLLDKMHRLYHTHTHLQLSTNHIESTCTSLTISFSNNAFLVETINKGATNNYIFLLRNPEVIQFHCELMQAISRLSDTIKSLIKI